MKVKIVFDKESEDAIYSCGWGISCLLGEDLLFDTGEKGEYILDNFKALDINISKINKVVISHNHWDHWGGVWKILDENPDMQVLACQDFIDQFEERLSCVSHRIVREKEELAPGIYTSGCVSTAYKGKEIKEQALILKTDKGISVICGCAHPGVVRFVKTAKDFFSAETIYSVIGGFHLMDKDRRYVGYLAEELKGLGVENVGPSHCTGFEASQILKEYYKNNYFQIRTGKCINL